MNDKEENPHRYDDIIEMEHHKSMKHRHMPSADRAAQFSPFAALKSPAMKKNEAAAKRSFAADP